MLDLQIGYANGNASFITVQTLGISFEGGCAASRDLLDVSDLESRGVRLSRVCVPLEEQRGETPYMEDYPIVRAGEVADLVFVKNGIEFLMFRDRYGELLDPTMSALFSPQEAIAHIAVYLAERLGTERLPQSVVDKILPADDMGDEDAESMAEDLAAAYSPNEATSDGVAGEGPDVDMEGMMDELGGVLGV